MLERRDITRSAVATLAALLAASVATGCSSGCNSYAPQLSNAVFDPVGLVRPSDHATTIKLCDGYGCTTHSARGAGELIVPHNQRAVNIRDLVAYVYRGDIVIRTARAPSVLHIPGGPASPNTDCTTNRAMLIVRYDPETEALYGT